MPALILEVGGEGLSLPAECTVTHLESGVSEYCGALVSRVLLQQEQQAHHALPLPLLTSCNFKSLELAAEQEPTLVTQSDAVSSPPNVEEALLVIAQQLESNLDSTAPLSNADASRVPTTIPGELSTDPPVSASVLPGHHVEPKEESRFPSRMERASNTKRALIQLLASEPADPAISEPELGPPETLAVEQVRCSETCTGPAGSPASAEAALQASASQVAEPLLEAPEPGFITGRTQSSDSSGLLALEVPQVTWMRAPGTNSTDFAVRHLSSARSECMAGSNTDDSMGLLLSTDSSQTGPAMPQPGEFSSKLSLLSTRSECVPQSRANTGEGDDEEGNLVLGRLRVRVFTAVPGGFGNFDGKFDAYSTPADAYSAPVLTSSPCVIARLGDQEKRCSEAVALAHGSIQKWTWGLKQRRSSLSTHAPCLQSFSSIRSYKSSKSMLTSSSHGSSRGRPFVELAFHVKHMRTDLEPYLWLELEASSGISLGWLEVPFLRNHGRWVKYSEYLMGGQGCKLEFAVIFAGLEGPSTSAPAPVDCIMSEHIKFGSQLPSVASCGNLEQVLPEAEAEQLEPDAGVDEAAESEMLESSDSDSESEPDSEHSCPGQEHNEAWTSPVLIDD